MKKIFLLLISIVFVISLASCVDQTQGSSNSSKEPRVVATSVATSQICGALEIPLVGVCNTNLYHIPEMYDDVERIGLPMGPDLEKIKSLKPTEVISPKSLQSFLEEQYKEIGLPYTFIPLSSVEGMYDSIKLLGEKYGKEEKAKELYDDYQAFMKEYREKHSHLKHPRVLILMGLPGSYVIATDKSYVGNLLELAGAENVFKDDIEDFLPVNTEAMINSKPDAIFRTSHAMPKSVMAEFERDFRDNDIWKHFDAVKNGRVYNLDNNYFGMSATMGYKEAIVSVEKQLYPDDEVD